MKIGKIIVVCCILIGSLASCEKPKEKKSDLVYNQHSKSLILTDTSYFISTIQILDTDKKDTAFVEFEDKLTTINLKTIPNYHTKEVIGNVDDILMSSNKLDFTILLEQKENKKSGKFFKFRTINPDSLGNIYAHEYGK